MDKDVEELRRRWEASVLLAGGRYAARINRAEAHQADVWEESIKKHLRAIRRIRKMIKKRQAKGG